MNETEWNFFFLRLNKKGVERDFGASDDSLSLSLSLLDIHTHTHSHSHTHPHTLAHTHSRTLTHVHTLSLLFKIKILNLTTFRVLELNERPSYF